MIESCIYEGHVRHRRFVPLENSFRYAVFLMYLDLDEISRILAPYRLWSCERANIASFRRRDHFGDPSVPLGEAVRDLVERETGRRPEGPVMMLAHLRYFGHCFNPVSFFYCYARGGETLETIVAEIRNTPWGERHCYVLDPSKNEASAPFRRYRFGKVFHVSPFMDMDMHYDWRFREPGEALSVHMTLLREGVSYFDATLTLRRREITRASLARALRRYPLMTVKVVLAIYFQALRLVIKGAPFFTHPSKRKALR